MTDIKIPDSVTSIGNHAFRNCIGLTTLFIPNSVTIIGDRAFLNVFNVEYNGIAAGEPWGAKCANGHVEKPLVYKNSSKTTLSGCHSTATGSIIIPDSVTHIEQNAFSGCKGLTSINVSPDNSNYCSVDGVLFNKDKTTIIQYPGGKQGAYTIPNSVAIIGDNAFSGCKGLTYIEIPNTTITSIGRSAFGGCSGLTSVTIPNRVTKIEGGTFSGTGLISVMIPKNVTSIGPLAFYNCTSLKSVTMEEANYPPKLTGIHVFDHRKDCLIYVLPESVDIYKAADGWKTYESQIKEIQQ